jgi:phosphate transport system protein
MERHFSKLLDQLNGRLVTMGTTAEAMIDKSVQALVERKGELIQEVYRLEGQVNQSQLDIDEEALRLLATQQPMAADLRFLVAAMKINGELERIGDQAVNICENTEFLLQHPPLKPLIDLPLMADAARKMLRESLDCFVRRDALEAKSVIMEDDRVDEFKDQILRELLTYMMSEPSTIPRAMSLVLISRNLERIADHAVNIGEEVIYMIEGKDVRHPKK